MKNKKIARKTKSFTILTALFFLALNANSVLAAFSSQCKTGQGGGPQHDCTHDNDQQILDTQCIIYYSSSTCSSMASYLNAMSVDCSKINPPNIDCGMITQNNYYGREASKFANYQEQHKEEPKPGPGPNPGPDCAFSGGWNMSNLSCLNIPESPIGKIVINAVRWILFMFGFIGILGFVISGIMYLTSAGDENQTEKAKKAMFYSIIGVIVGILGVVALKFAAGFLSGALMFQL